MAKLTPEYVVSALQARGVPPHVAQGVVMNFKDESGLNTSIQERSPNVHGTRGYGLAQWTGPRRRALEQFAQAQGKPVDDPDLQLDYFMRENQGPEAKAWNQVMAAPTAQDAAVAFVNKWERPAAQHAASRSARYRHVGGAGSGGENFAPVQGPFFGSMNGSGSSGGGIDPIAAELAAGPKKKEKKKGSVLGNIGAALDASIPNAPSPGGGGGGFGNAGGILATIMQNPQALAQALMKRRIV